MIVHHIYPAAISTHALREEGDLLRYKEPEPDKRFLPTPSARRATKNPAAVAHHHRHFYPRPPRGGRPARPLRARSARPFLPTPSARRATA